MIIKALLITSVLVGCAWLLRGQASAGRLALTRLGGLALAAAWIVAVLFPDVVTAVANAVGVGRGSDLLLYATVVAFMFTTLLQQRRNRDLEWRIATVSRRLALAEHAPAAARPHDGGVREHV